MYLSILQVWFSQAEYRSHDLKLWFKSLEQRKSHSLYLWLKSERIKACLLANKLGSDQWNRGDNMARIFVSSQREER